MSSHAASARRAARAVTVPDADVATTPSRSSASCSEPVAKSASSTAPYSRQHGGILEGDRHAVSQADPLHTHDFRVRLQPERVDLLRARRRDPRRDHPRAGDLAPPLHLVAERQEHPGPTVHRPAGDERALAPMPIDEPGVRQLLQRLAHGHPADAEAGAQLRLARQRATGLGPGDQPTQIVLDLSVAGGGRRAR